MSKFYITTSIIYASQPPHIGNTYEAIVTDAVARYHKLIGDDVYFLTGTDEHGLKIERNAEKEGVTPQEFVDRIAGNLRKEWDLCMVEYNDFIRTTEDRHKNIVKRMFKKLYDQGDIYKKSYEGWYCVPDEAFHTDSQINKTPDGNLCPDCGRPVEWLKEEVYFFRLSAYADRLAAHIDQNPDFIQPDNRRNEMVNGYIKPGLQDFCVSRMSFKWGIPVEFDPGHVMYVWVDALSNYITALGYDPSEQRDAAPHDRSAETKKTSLFDQYWPCDVHVIGKDILRFHTLYWPGLLMALGVPLPKQVFAHPWFLMGSDKMSKSLGNVIYAPELVDKYGVDCTRYYVLREMPFARDGNITRELFVSRCNTDLANDLGNLASRSITMAEKYFDGTVTPECVPQNEVLELCAASRERYTDAMEKLAIQTAVTEAMAPVIRANRFIDETMPWELAKDPDKTEDLRQVLYTLLETLRGASILLYPVMPLAMGKLRLQLGLTEVPVWDEKPPAGFTVKRGDNLFPRIVMEEAAT
ncbi:MAG: methionine--tRNA ligase [Oscillospiraceae bacterium]|jgi:methionyl-tRNA synthetase|nr:methionine--tRNA ligase [Oscillospiraceae bacterium]